MKAKKKAKKLCNICGKKLGEWDKDSDYTMRVHMGYGTNHDLEYAEIHMCCECLDHLVENCAVNPIVGEYDICTGRVTMNGT